MSTLAHLDSLWRDRADVPRALAILLSFGEYNEDTLALSEDKQHDFAVALMTDSQEARYLWSAEYDLPHTECHHLVSTYLGYASTQQHYLRGEEVWAVTPIRILERLGYIDGLRGYPKSYHDYAMSSQGLMPDPNTPSAIKPTKPPPGLAWRIERIVMVAYTRGHQYGVAERQLSLLEPEILHRIDAAAAKLLPNSASGRPSDFSFLESEITSFFPNREIYIKARTRTLQRLSAAATLSHTYGPLSEAPLGDIVTAIGNHIIATLNRPSAGEYAADYLWLELARRGLTPGTAAQALRSGELEPYPPEVMLSASVTLVLSALGQPPAQGLLWPDISPDDTSLGDALTQAVSPTTIYRAAEFSPSRTSRPPSKALTELTAAVSSLPLPKQVRLVYPAAYIVAHQPIWPDPQDLEPSWLTLNTIAQQTSDPSSPEAALSWYTRKRLGSLIAPLLLREADPGFYYLTQAQIWLVKNGDIQDCELLEHRLHSLHSLMKQTIIATPDEPNPYFAAAMMLSSALRHRALCESRQTVDNLLTSHGHGVNELTVRTALTAGLRFSDTFAAKEPYFASRLSWGVAVAILELFQTQAA